MLWNEYPDPSHNKLSTEITQRLTKLQMKIRVEIRVQRQLDYRDIGIGIHQDQWHKHTVIKTSFIVECCFDAFILQMLANSFSASAGCPGQGY